MGLDKLLYFDELEKLELPKDDFVIYGSAPLVIRGLKEKNSDIDILVREKLWNELTKKYPVQIGIGFGNTYRKYIELGHIEIDPALGDFTDNIDLIIDRADELNGYRVMKLEDMIKLKEHMGREKDLVDLKNMNIKRNL